MTTTRTDGRDAETILIDVFAELLDADVGPDDSFFDLGGHSLMIAELVRVAAAEGLVVSIPAVLGGRTPQGIAALLDPGTPAVDALDLGPPPVHIDTLWAQARSQHEDAPERVVPLKPGVGEPLFVVHWGNGNIRFLDEVVDAWSPQRPVLGIEAAGYRGAVRPSTSIVQMARLYVGDILRHQEHGPFHIAGLCQGALVAQEVARMLADLGHEVRVLVLINTPAAPMTDRGWGLSELLEFRRSFLADRFSLRDQVADVRPVLDHMKTICWYDQDIAEDDFWRLQFVWTTGMFAQDHHEPAAYAGPTLMFQALAEEQPWRDRWPRLLPSHQVRWYDAPDTITIVRHPEVAAMISAALR